MHDGEVKNYEILIPGAPKIIIKASAWNIENSHLRLYKGSRRCDENCIAVFNMDNIIGFRQTLEDNAPE